jgi:hypothetical protein
VLQFYELMSSTVAVRRQLVDRSSASLAIGPAEVAPLRAALEALRAIPQDGSGHTLALDEHRQMSLDLRYELGELEKDIIFLEQGEESLRRHLAERHEGFDEQVREGVELLRETRFQALLTDRDGTVNNYCGRYASSVQSVYNAVFLTRFARTRAEFAVILTSAPLANVGLVDISVAPEHVFTYAGSKGREYLDARGERRRFPIERRKQEKLDELNVRLAALVREPGREPFTLIGSGLQLKFGQTTIARQDIGGSIPRATSESFRAEVEQLVSSLDPTGSFFRIEDTGLDVEIVLTVDGGEETRDFDKGDGIRFLNADMRLEMGRGDCLVCGDTASDIPMVAATMAIAPETHVFFVTRDEGLRARVRATCPHAQFVDEPDVLVTMLNEVALSSPPTSV